NDAATMRNKSSGVRIVEIFDRRPVHSLRWLLACLGEPIFLWGLLHGFFLRAGPDPIPSRDRTAGEWFGTSARFPAISFRCGVVGRDRVALLINCVPFGLTAFLALPVAGCAILPEVAGAEQLVEGQLPILGIELVGTPDFGIEVAEPRIVLG